MLQVQMRQRLYLFEAWLRAGRYMQYGRKSIFNVKLFIRLIFAIINY